MKIQITFDDGSVSTLDNDFHGKVYINSDKLIGATREKLNVTEQLSRIGMIIHQEAEFIYQRAEQK